MPLLRAIALEAASLVSIALFVGTLLCWAAILN